MKQKDFLIILIPIFILTILWVIFNIYHNHVTSTIKDPLTTQTIPIEGKFDANTIEAVKNRQRVDPLYEIQGTPTPEEQIIEKVTPTPTLEPEPTITPTEILIQTEPSPTDQGLTP